MTVRTDSLWKGIEAIVLDAVGTLIDPDPPVFEAYAAAARSQGVTLDAALVRERFVHFFRAEDENDGRRALATDEGVEFERWRRIVTGVLAEVPNPERAFSHLWDHFGRADAWRCFPDVAPALETLTRGGVPIVIASNFDARLRAVVAGLPELAGVASELIISSEIGYRKPHPSIYKAACAALDRAPATILAVGDDMENDVIGACRAGLRGVWLDRKGRGGDQGFPRARDLVTIVSGRTG